MADYITYQDLIQFTQASNKTYDMQLVDRAYRLAEKAHAGQFRRSGEPYICHPLSVAKLLVELGMDSESVAGGLLHDVVEDTSVTIEDIRRDFGADIALLVDGVTKLTKIQFSSVEEQQVENLRKMLMAMSQDVRVMIIKLCDRLHNMRTGDAWPEQKRRDKALETMEVYAPIAHRLGMSNIKEQLEDRSLWYLDPVAYTEINELVHRTDSSFLENICRVVRQHLEDNGIHDMQIKSRIKSVYGIYRKMYMQNREFAEIYDVYAVRIILDTVAECYTALGLIHDMYHPIPNRFKDYISTPKPNGYKSLHTTVIGNEPIPFEVQIRTREMDQEAEYGVAAHWKYKAGISATDKSDARLAWLRQLLESQKEETDPDELLRDIKSDLLPEEVFAFTPRGDVINLPAGATAIDFAYAIHSAVGNRMIGCKVNGHIVPIDHKVSTGEIIEVITGQEDKGPSRDWLKIVKTSEAKNKIRSWFKKERREENIQEGREALERELRRNSLRIPQDRWDEFIGEIARRQHMNTVEELYAALGYGGLLISKIMPKIREEYQKLKATEIRVAAPLPAVHASNGVIIEGVDNCPIKFARCCKPLPGDRIVGFITRGFGVSVHKCDCPNVIAARKNPENDGRFLPASWEETGKEQYRATLVVDAMNRDGLLNDLVANLTDMRVPIFGMNAKEIDGDRAQMVVTVGTTNVEHLNSVEARIRKIRDVVSVQRM